ncbi:hypothetical protein CEXT_668651 [Caerostris extrusa]|uniref:Uncharacterized protein n=1 Tax=Caerostris extrusa TaxID=172846 RepID=A0AAV4T5U9_CAEEX|nr:hypothetical protein CEXT_668651 [Caerostris extrusa]
MFLLAFGQSLMESVICIVGHLLTYQKPLSGVAISRIDYYVWAFRDKGQLCAWVACQGGGNNLLFIVSTPSCQWNQQSTSITACHAFDYPTSSLPAHAHGLQGLWKIASEDVEKVYLLKKIKLRIP